MVPLEVRGFYASLIRSEKVKGELVEKCYQKLARV